MARWEYDREVKWHTRSVESTDQDVFVFIYKTEGGEYVVSAMREGDASGGEIEYFDTLAKAKRHGEKIAADGTYVDYLTSECE
jgi:hypothetical protein